MAMPVKFLPLRVFFLFLMQVYDNLVFAKQNMAFVRIELAAQVHVAEALFARRTSREVAHASR